MGRTADWYRNFARAEARGQSAIYEDWASGVAVDLDVLHLLHELPLAKRQPNLIFAVSRLLGAPETGYAMFRLWLQAEWPRVAAEARVRSTQTNEPGRCAALLPLLARLPQPLALLEVGASAGLCLYPDRYSYSYNGGHPLDPAAGGSTVLLRSAADGRRSAARSASRHRLARRNRSRPAGCPRPAERTWLQTLVWPEQHERLARIRSAMAIVGAEPPRIVKGDAGGRPCRPRRPGARPAPPWSSSTAEPWCI